MWPASTHPRTAASQRGAVAVSFIILIVLLLGFMGLATDAGRLYVSKTELQNAADACALSAAAALTGANANQLQVAENYGITAGIRNLVGMQATAVSIVADQDVTFSASLNGAYATRTAAAGNELNMRYARCTLTESNIQTLIIQVINLLPGQTVGAGEVRATAVASLEPSISNCALPLAICQADLAGKAPGTWIQGILQAGDSIQGAFKWIEFPGYERNKDLEGLIKGSGQCDLDDAQNIGSHPGFTDSMLRSWNSRFGVYRPGGPTATEAPPDLTGWVYNPTTFPTQNNALPDFLIKRGQSTPKHQAAGAYNLPNPNDWATDTQFQNGQDRRLVVGPIVDCPALASNGNTNVQGWACYLMLNPVFNPGDTMYLEYRGLAGSPSSGCVTSGAPGGPGAGGPKVPALVQ